MLRAQHSAAPSAALTAVLRSSDTLESRLLAEERVAVTNYSVTANLSLRGPQQRCSSRMAVPSSVGRTCYVITMRSQK